MNMAWDACEKGQALVQRWKYCECRVGQALMQMHGAVVSRCNTLDVHVEPGGIRLEAALGMTQTQLAPAVAWLRLH